MSGYNYHILDFWIFRVYDSLTVQVNDDLLQIQSFPRSPTCTATSIVGKYVSEWFTL